MAEGWTSTDRHSPSKQQADLQKPRPRFGLSAFFRPQKTVCPLTQQAALDGVHGTKAEPLTSSPPAQLEGMDDRADRCSAWGTLPEHLVEAVMQLLLEEPQPPLHSTSKPIKQTQFAVTAVSQLWRQIGRRIFFRSMWSSSGAIKHPVQLLELSPAPVHSCAQLVKCVMKREYDSSQKKSVRYTLRQGDRLSSSTFLMTALQASRLDIRIYLASSCTGTPCARIETNLLGTRYEIVLDSTVQPFAQHETMHSHTPLLTYDRLLSANQVHSMQSVQSVSDEFDVPVLDLPSTSGTELALSTPSPSQSASHGAPQHAAASASLAPDVLSTSASGFEADLAASNDTLCDVSPPNLAPRASGLLQRLKLGKQSTAATALQSPFAASSSAPANSNADANLPSSPGPSSPVATSRHVARCQSAMEQTYPSQRQTSANLAPNSPPSPAASNFFTRSRSDKMQGNSPAAEGSSEMPSCSCQTVPKSVGGVHYKTRIRGFMRPRRMRVSLPPPAALACFDTSAAGSCCSRTLSKDFGSRLLVTPAPATEPALPSTPEQTGTEHGSIPTSPSTSNHQTPEGSLASSSQVHLGPCTPTHSQTETPAVASSRLCSSFQKGIELRNKPPHWNDTLRCWCLNFRGRVKLASVKNFQLIKADDPSKTIVMQFGKVDASTYIMDYNPAEINAIQAFAISLSTFDTKLLL